MLARRKAAAVAAAGVAPLALTVLTATPAAAHGSMTDPVSRVSACFQEGPESPESAACKAAVAAGGTQALYDWNGVNIADAAGKSQEIIPDGELCSAGNDKYRGLDLPRADWPSSTLAAGDHTFRYRATAPHRGSFALYLTKDSYDPSKPLKWSDLEAEPFAEVTDPKLVNGEYVFDGKVPARSGRHLVYSIWQRSDSPEAFYTCSDVVFGKDSGGSAPAPAASAPSDEDIAAGAGKSSVEHHGHGDADAKTGAEVTAPAPAAETEAGAAGEEASGSRPAAKGGAEKPVTAADDRLAETGDSGATSYLAIGGAAALAVGAAAMFATTRRRAAGRHGR
ncbi:MULTISPECIES: lytic polysaccharide monooxygenase auxiliary activity family 9 protein [unclassified Streptomyces]|uniref:lytic polysaccharide monooxygenase auxiliary activity family 9 protein n=1 Tax=unclassified Streptomyces TaxID=2593676 RepID=UPI0007462A64|nr:MULTISPECIES: lytic polysaccharide monooxygenase [unclassified Streptomyces]KUL59237.1 chitin-binding protein [Streptomyces sp. NRRL S-1521]THC45556.1 LPXTG cell wall anchor domain-containing protein [Streptomyces sp. A1499]